MNYHEFKAAIQQHLRRSRAGATWAELRDKLGLPYDRPCPEWTRRLEEDIGLVRSKGAGRALIWKTMKTALVSLMMVWHVSAGGGEPGKNAVYDRGLASLTFAYPQSFVEDPKAKKEDIRWWARFTSPKGDLSIEAMSLGYCSERLRAVEGYKSPEAYVLKEICGPNPVRTKFDGYDRLISRTGTSVTVVFLLHGSEWGKCYQQMTFHFADGAYASQVATIEQVIKSTLPSFDVNRWNEAIR